jgi:hypothetical protein
MNLFPGGSEFTDRGLSLAGSRHRSSFTGGAKRKLHLFDSHDDQ